MQELCSNGQGKNKVKYKTRAAAEKAARKTKSGLALHIYRCPRCFEFHLTSQERRNKPEAIPSAAKLRRKLENYGREIAAAQKRYEAARQQFAAADKALEDTKKEAGCFAARAHAFAADELAYIQCATEKLFGKRE
jgi:hypothetical protein